MQHKKNMYLFELMVFSSLAICMVQQCFPGKWYLFCSTVLDSVCNIYITTQCVDILMATRVELFGEHLGYKLSYACKNKHYLVCACIP